MRSRKEGQPRRKLAKKARKKRQCVPVKKVIFKTTPNPLRKQHRDAMHAQHLPDFGNSDSKGGLSVSPLEKLLSQVKSPPVTKSLRVAANMHLLFPSSFFALASK